MEKNQKSVLMMSMIIACFMLVAVIGVGYAAFSIGLNVKGTGEVQASNWNVHFEGISDATVYSKNNPGTAESVTAPQLNEDSTAVNGFKVKLQTPGDSVSYTFDVVNDGTFDAQIVGVTKKDPTCTGFSGATTAAQDALNVCNHLTYKLTYADNGNEVKVGDPILANKSRRTLKLTITYNEFDEESLLPKQDVTIDDLDISIQYAQVQNS